MPSTIKKIFLSKDTLIFLIFLLLSGVLWFTQALDKQRITTIRVPIDYMGLPKGVELTGDIPTEVSIKIRDEGMTLIKYGQEERIPLTIDLNRLYSDKGNILISSEQLKNRVSRYVRPTTAILKIEPDSILLKYNKLTTVKLPIELDTNIVLASQYMYSAPMMVEPKTVSVFGPKSKLDSMKVVMTEPIKIDELNDTIRMKVKLKSPEDGIKYDIQEVDLSIFVEMFTERKSLIPIKIINNNEKLKIKLFPASATVKYNVGLSNYSKIRENDLQLVFDISKAKATKSKQYQLELVNNSPYIKNLSISPAQVEFLIEE